MSRPAEIFEPDYYDRLEAIESRHWWTLGMTDLMERLLEGSLPEGSGARFLDIGCGSGIGLSWAARRLPRALRLGIDLSPHGLEHCRGRGAALQCASAGALPFAAGTIDLALCLDVLQHLDDEAPALREAARVLRDGGTLFLRTNALGFETPPPGSVLFTRARLRRGLESAGLEMLRCSRANALGSLVAELSNRRRRAPGHGGAAATGHGGAAATGHGGGYGGGLRIEPESQPGVASRLKRALLRLEGAWIRRGGQLPLGHSLVCVARKPIRG